MVRLVIGIKKIYFVVVINYKERKSEHCLNRIRNPNIKRFFIRFYAFFD